MFHAFHQFIALVAEQICKNCTLLSEIFEKCFEFDMSLKEYLEIYFKNHGGF